MVKVKSSTWILVVFIVLIGAIILGVRYFNNSTRINQEQLEKIVVRLQENGGNFDKPLILIFVFTPEDCFMCLKEIDYMSDYCENREELQCYGLVNHPHRSLVLEFVENSDWEFPVFVDQKIPELSEIGFPRTPFKLMMNSDKELLFAEGALTEWETEGQLEPFLSERLNNIQQ